MSENKKPENLLAEIAYSKKRVHASYYKDGKFTHAYEIVPFLNTGLYDDGVEEAVLRELGRLLKGQKCGIIVQAAGTSDSETVVQVYKLPDGLKRHRLFSGSDDYFIMDAWLRTALNAADVADVDHTLTASATACVPLRSVEFGDFRVQRERVETKEEKLSPSAWVEKHHYNGLRMFVGSTPVLPVRNPSDHIPALRGLFALARGDYATVSPDDLSAAVDAGYVHPDVLACVADEIAYAVQVAE
jgi:hypothetical protein